MRRRLFTGVSVVSLVLCMGAVVLWVRSYWMGDIWQLSRLIRQQQPTAGEDEYQFLRIAVAGGYCAVECGRSSAVHGFRVKRLFHVGGPLPAGVASQARDQIGGIENRPFSLAAPVLLLAVLPGFWIVLRMGNRRRNCKCCQKCGYDLTGNVSGVCPECGAVVAGKGEA